MKTIYSNHRQTTACAIRQTLNGAAALTALMFAPSLLADETCSSPYLARIEGQEEFVYVHAIAEALDAECPDINEFLLAFDAGKVG